MSLLTRYKQVVTTMDELLLLISDARKADLASADEQQEGRRVRYSSLQRRKRTLTFLYHLTLLARLASRK